MSALRGPLAALRAVLFVAALFLGALSPAASALQTVSSGISQSATVAADSHDAYQVNVPGDATATVTFTTQGGALVDFYLMTATGYAEYVDPNSPSFHTVDDRENAASYSHSTTQSGLVFVIDNAPVTASGASGATPVTYEITVAFAAAGPTSLSLALAAIAGVAVFGSIAAVLLRQRRRRQALVAPALGPNVPPQYATIPPPPSDAAALPPPPVDDTTAPVAPLPQSPGKVQRSLTPEERGVLVRDFQKQKGKAAALPVFGLVLSVVYMMYPDWTLIGLTIPAFIAPLVVQAFVKHRRAIAAGNVTEFRGIPTFAGTEGVGKQQFYRMLFGTETVSVSPGLYGRMVPNQANTLAVLEQANIVIAVNGAPMPTLTERVRFAAPTGQTASLAGVG